MKAIAIELTEQDWLNISGAIKFFYQNNLQLTHLGANYYSALGYRLEEQLEKAKETPSTGAIDEKTLEVERYTNGKQPVLADPDHE